MRQKSRAKISLTKQRKRQSKVKRRPVEKKRKRTLKQSFRSVNAKILKKITRDGRFLSQEAKGLIIHFMEDIYKQVSIEAERLRRKSHHSLVSPMHVRAALQRVVPKRRLRRVPAVASRNRH